MPKSSQKHPVYREAWLLMAVERLNGMIAERTTLKPSTKVQVSVGWPSRGGLSTAQMRVGECWALSKGAKGSHNIFVSPRLGTATEVLHVLLHELIHAADNCQNGHKGAFAKAAKAVGLEGKMTATVPGSALKAELRALAGELGPYPHKKLVTNDTEQKKPGSRLVKVECPDCGYIVRTTQKWLEVGLPTCCCGTQMEEA